MSLCYCLRQRWHTFKNIVYGYDETYNNRKQHAKDPWDMFANEEKNRHIYFSEKENDVFGENKTCSENWCNYCIPKRQVYESYGIEFETREERDAFENKMECMEMILENELRDIRQQHMRLKEERTKTPRGKDNKGGKSKLMNKKARVSRTDSGTRYDFPKKREALDDTDFLRTDDNPLIEEVSLVNEVQDVLDQMCNLSRELQDIEKILSIEVRERILHPEPRLIQIKAPDDELSEQMRNDGGFRYCSSDSSLQRISYDTLPPPLALNELLARQPQYDT
ncbi:uncharacterized protein LOC114524788 [Dendronephthya gigantea]|uniref:uncharacterized protein LOC114524788 n=1 Tax=Dendronephthya gigantea TaxID=151771 RepID=UPI00106C3735|nr:uncharacterized protein LOC114524788 [Dendronephthya gigantea]